MRDWLSEARFRNVRREERLREGERPSGRTVRRTLAIAIEDLNERYCESILI